VACERVKPTYIFNFEVISGKINVIKIDISDNHTQRRTRGGSKSFRSNIQKPRQMENAARDIQRHLW